MARTVTTSSTFEDWRQSYNDLAVDVGDPTSLTTADKSSVVNAINYIMDQYFYFQDFDFDGSDGATSNTVFSGQDNNGTTLAYMASKVLVYKNGLLLRSGTDYTAVNGTSVTLTSSANNGDVIRISSYTGSYTATPAGQESNYIWSTAGAIIHNRNDGGIVFNSDSTTDTTLDVANSFQFNGPVYAVEDVYINNQKDLRFKEGSGNGSNYVAVQAPASISTNRTLTLPDAEDGYMLAVAAVGSNGQVLSSDGDGSYSWTNVSNTNTTYTTSWVDSSDDAILRLTPSTGSADDLTIVAGTGITVTPSGDNLTIAATASEPTAITITANNTTNETVYPTFVDGATGSQGLETDTGLSYNPSGGVLTATTFQGSLTGNVTGNASGTAATVTGGTQVAITSAANLATVGTITTGVWSGTALVSAKIGNDQIDSQHIADGAIDDPAMMATGVVQIAKIDPSLIQLSSESFADNDTSLMTSAAIQDKILGYGYTTETGDITGVTAGSGMSGGGTSGTVTLTNAGVTSIVAGSNVSISGATGAVTVTSTDTNTQLSTEQVQDIVGGMFSGNTETRIAATYEDGDGTIDLVVNDMTANTNYYLDGISKSSNTLTFSVNGATNQTYTFGSNAFNSTAFTTNTGTLTPTGTVNANEFARYTGATTLEALTAAETKTALSLNNVENTALSSWAGTTNITTVGTISSGTWSGTALVSAKIGNDQIDSQHYVDASIDHAHLANNLIDGDNIQDNVIDSEHYVDGSIDNAHLASNAVTQFVVADESSDTTCFPLFVGSATGNLLPKTGSNLTFNSSTGALGAGPLTITGAITATGDITAFHSSDIALKENLINIPNPLEKISKISGYMFDWKDHKDPNVIGEGHDVGIIAQEVEKVLPEIVITRDNGKKAVNYQKIIPLLVESIKELKTEIESLKNSKS